MPRPYRFIKLTFAERVKIRLELERLNQAGRTRECKRLLVVRHSNRGLTYQDICHLEKVGYRSVKRWISDYRKGGLERLLKRAK